MSVWSYLLALCKLSTGTVLAGGLTGVDSYKFLSVQEDWYDFSLPNISNSFALTIPLCTIFSFSFYVLIQHLMPEIMKPTKCVSYVAAEKLIITSLTYISLLFPLKHAWPGFLFYCNLVLLLHTSSSMKNPYHTVCVFGWVGVRF